MHSKRQQAEDLLLSYLLPDSVISQMVGVSSSSVGRWRVNLGIPPLSKSPGYSPLSYAREVRAKGERLIKEGKTDAEICRIIQSRTGAAVASWRRNLNRWGTDRIPFPDPPGVPCVSQPQLPTPSPNISSPSGGSTMSFRKFLKRWIFSGSPADAARPGKRITRKTVIGPATLWRRLLETEGALRGARAAAQAAREREEALTEKVLSLRSLLDPSADSVEQVLHLVSERLSTAEGTAVEDATKSKMNEDEARILGEQALSHRNWRWMPGMLVLARPTDYRIVCEDCGAVSGDDDLVHSYVRREIPRLPAGRVVEGPGMNHLFAATLGDIPLFVVHWNGTQYTPGSLEGRIPDLRDPITQGCLRLLERTP